MSAQTISIDFPSDILLTINESEQELKKRIKLSLAIQLYSQLKITLGKASQIAGMSRLEFEATLSDMNIPLSLIEIGDVLGDVEKLRRHE
ncbi:MAG: UPF0175 family protein [Bacteroidia bacterium]